MPIDDLCGHATLAAAHVYLTEINPDLNSVTFDTKFVGFLKVDKIDDRYQMDFPSRPGDEVALEDVPSFIMEALSDHKPVAARKARDLMLVYDNEQIVRDIDPDFNALTAYEDFIIVTAASEDTRYDFISRFFCAEDTLPEDPVTGSAHCTSGPYWAEKLGKMTLSAYQASKRGGDLELELAKDRIFISGKAVTVIAGTMVSQHE